MGFSTIVGTIAFLFIFASMIAFTMTVQKGIAETAKEASARADANAAQLNSALTIISSEYDIESVIPVRDDAYADFASGSGAGTRVVSPGTLELEGPAYNDSVFTSRVFDSGVAGSNLTTLNWTSVVPADTAVLFQLRSGVSLAAIGAASWTGPDGTGGTYYTASGTQADNSVLAPARYFQYQATFDTNNSAVTPSIQTVSLGVGRPGGTTVLIVKNSGSQSLVVSETDVYLGGSRFPRNDSYRTLDISSLSDQILWQPGQNITIAVFATLTPPVTVTIANEAATASGTVS